MSDVGNSDISWSDGSGGSGKMRWLRKVCKSVSGNGYFNSGGGRMKKGWYDYLWIASLMYLVLGFFQILFAWLGLLCFFIPLFKVTYSINNTSFYEKCFFFTSDTLLDNTENVQYLYRNLLFRNRKVNLNFKKSEVIVC
jgi:hypothetical protein